MNRVKEYKQARHLNVYNVGACFHSILINTNVNLFTDSLLQANSHSYILYIKSNIPHDMPPRIYTHTHTRPLTTRHSTTLPFKGYELAVISSIDRERIDQNDIYIPTLRIIAFDHLALFFPERIIVSHHKDHRLFDY